MSEKSAKLISRKFSFVTHPQYLMLSLAYMLKPSFLSSPFVLKIL